MDSSNEIRERYAKEAETYRRDAWLINIDAEMLFQEFKRMVNNLYPDNSLRLKILDIGAGNGMLTELILSVLPNAEVTMLDFSSEMLESAQAIFETNNVPTTNIKSVVKNFITDEFPNEKYDLVISSYALHHIRKISDLKIVYLKIANSLKEDGTFICLDNYLGDDTQKRDEQVRLAFEAWTKNYNSSEVAKEWAGIIKGEDTPSTISLIINSINSCNGDNLNVIPLVSPKVGILAFIYGMTKLSLEELKLKDLNQLAEEATNHVGKEELIASYPFDKYL
ncbi:MAG: class I SAM-dependent methyltransferase [Erysipelotrichales bacterium]|nr:class I SAM-dependent methyltransferase [Erysipelotrichales bacterium]